MKTCLTIFCLVFGLTLGNLSAEESAKLEMRGLITAVEENSVMIQDSAGKTWQFEITKDLDVPLKHLKEHQKQKWPVSVHYQIKKDKKIAVKITD